ncbi:FtsP/CotA-like multicopper oxidase with cupredoxin domain [Nonomuraea polychroma]|uniref:FtsP/CotA-like multicopper oxidase with cupredoxin domain n=1 Tax=Nonomuraea polychroma TaxID=46176 RepID=A0A438M6T5_9ACTN|nr:multicopper oxidase domain-containing protein [Nonomuraea polychroma]RVX41406.1 FtsP/CotA-like multicopper oxidase with cupredoxin domain [Nonomuraea polychroma]
MRRRKFLKVGLASVSALAVAGGGGFGWAWLSSATGNVDELAFDLPLRIPPLLEGGSFDLRLQAGVSELRPGTKTGTWGVNGPHLGPTLRMRRGETVSPRVHNALPEATSVHWHGMRLPATMDGGPHQMIAPGSTWKPTWKIDQPAATLWYHPHLHGTTARHVYQGLAGLFLIDDEHAAKLPHEYGVDDIPLIIQDATFDGDGSLTLDNFGMSVVPGMDLMGFLGKEVLVNGTLGPAFTVTTTRVRLRLLNASVGRVYNVGFADDREFALVATDSGLVGEPVRLTRVLLASGERAEIVVDFRPGEQVVLRSFTAELGGGTAFDRFAGGADAFDLMKFTADGRLAESAAVPARLADVQAPVVPPNAKTRTFRLGSTSINDKKMDLARIDEVVPAGATEIWELNNPSAYHSFHIHEASFRILDVNGKAPAAYEAGRKDTVYVPPEGHVRLLVEFGRHTDPAAPYMFHCHMLVHEDKGMMGQFVIVEPGQESQVNTRLNLKNGHAAH